MFFLFLIYIFCLTLYYYSFAQLDILKETCCVCGDKTGILSFNLNQVVFVPKHKHHVKFKTQSNVMFQNIHGIKKHVLPTFSLYIHSTQPLASL